MRRHIKIFVYPISLTWKVTQYRYSFGLFLFSFINISKKSLSLRRSSTFLYRCWYSVLWTCQSLFNHSSMYGHLVSFKYFASTNTATMNNVVHVYFHIVEDASSVYIPRSHIAGSKCKYIYSFTKYCQIPLPKGCLVCISTQRCTEDVILHSHTHRMYRQTFSWSPIIISRCLCCIILHLSNCD